MEYTLTIAEKKVETPDTVTIRFRQPAFKKMKYRAGQYITVIVTVNGRKYRRPYSISSVYGLDTTIDITVKEVPGGVVSGHIVRHWQPGDSIAVMEPMGDYLLPEQTDGHTLYCWCAGSGITPNYAIIREALHNRPALEQIVLVYGNRHYGTTIFKEELNSLLNAHGERLKVYHVHSQPIAGEAAYYNRRLDSACVNRLLQQGQGPALHYICGPAAMTQLVQSALTEKGVACEQVFTESFEKYDTAALPDGVVAAAAIVQQHDITRQLAVARGSSLLDACLDAGLDIVYSCQGGSCGLCTAHVLQGEVFTTQAPGYGREGDSCLLCSSYPLTEQLSLQIP
ncbi:ring-1,2-phenylacetyl-CoA epoxidase subunit PaaE [Filimonas zeae]|uniref:Phenylacetic acid degradation protein n=1 Tax=Filimonas zeae TaxID=1737353 RepID=A0A917IVV2_9BACT|nr:ferredoxin--NADP reductase [Filimonas zeae]MDR6339005.1 ring-1,2-phenylacetyl-CoA epoxidase subunit PaaE [Filimonas zeae]GGH65558.1 phenylacetic acid degradation protein [Filimonas zeae]